VATYADACNLIGTPEVVAHKLEVIRRHCDAVGRDPEEIEVTALLGQLPSDADADAVVRQAESLGAVGVQTVMVGAVGPEPARWLEEVIGPAVDRLSEVESGTP